MTKILQPYQKSAYDFCDLLDEIADTNPAGASWAQTLASQAITTAAAYFPRATKTILGDSLVASYKSVAAKLPVKMKQTPADAIDMAIERLRLAATERAKTAGDAQIAQAIDAFTAQLAPATPGRATLADSGDQSVATKRKEVANPWQNPDFRDPRLM